MSTCPLIWTVIGFSRGYGRHLGLFLDGLLSWRTFSNAMMEDAEGNLKGLAIVKISYLLALLTLTLAFPLIDYRLSFLTWR